MKTIKKKIGTLLTTGFLLAAGSSAHAALLEVDFGNGDGKDGQGGFALLGRGAITQQTDWINYSLGSQGRNRLSTYTTTALSGANALSRDAGSSYTFTSEIRINSMITTQATRNLSLVIFGDNTAANDGIALKLYTGGDGNTFQIDLGTRDFSSDVSTGDRKVWGGAAFVGSGAVFTLEGTVNFTADDAIVLFRLSDDNGFTDTVSRTIAKSTLATVGGDRHGISLFHRGTNYDAFNFAVMPEPGTLVLVGNALGSLLLFRRRR